MSDAVAVALIAAVGSTAAAVISAIALRQSRSTHTLINSRMDEFLTEARKASRAEGVAAGEQSQRDRDQRPSEDRK